MKGFKKFLAVVAFLGAVAAVAALLYNKFKSDAIEDDFEDFDDEDFDDDFDDIDVENRGYTSIPLEEEATDDIEVDIVDNGDEK